MTELNSTPENPSSSPSHATFILISMCCIAYTSSIFDASIQYSRAVELLALSRQTVWAGEIWRLLTANFLHLNPIHLALNCFVLYNIGRIAEPIFGSSRTLFIAFICGIAAMASSILVNTSASAGASALIFGLAGAVIGARLIAHQRMVERQQLKALFVLVIANISLGLAANHWIVSALQIDNTAHISATLFGFLTGLSFSSENRGAQHKYGRHLPNLGLAVTSFLFALTCVAGIKPVFLAQYHLVMAHHLIGQQNILAAQLEIDWLRGRKDSVGYGDILQGRIARATNNISQADQFFRQGLAEIDSHSSTALSKVLANSGFENLNDALFFDETGNARLCVLALKDDGQSQELLNNCAWLLLTSRKLSLRDPVLALNWVQSAVNDFPEVSPKILQTLSEAYRQNGDLREAQLAMQRAHAAEFSS